MDEVRKFVIEEADRRGQTLAFLSKKFHRNHAYFQQFIDRGTPRHLPEDLRTELAKFWQVDEAKLGAPSRRAPRQRVVPPDQEFPPDPEFVVESENAAAAKRADRRNLRPGEIVERDVIAGLSAGNEAPTIMIDGKTVNNVRATWTLPVEYLRTELRASELDVDIIAVNGDSMQPTLVPGDRVMINKRQIAPSPDGLYAIHDGIGVVVKRIEVMQGSSPVRVRVKSDNPAHSSYEQPADEVRVIGRVICKVTRM